jgi:hypothetical protein
MLGAEHTTRTSLSRISLPISVFQRAGWAGSSSSSDNQPAPRDSSSSQPASGGSTIVWCVLAAFFALLVFGYPSLLTFLGDFHGLRFLLRLGSSLMVLGVLAVVAGAIHWATSK